MSCSAVSGMPVLVLAPAVVPRRRLVTILQLNTHSHNNFRKKGGTEGEWRNLTWDTLTDIDQILQTMQCCNYLFIVSMSLAMISRPY